jgi:ABC-type uncharacterized transport system auxiliary subunit
MSKLGWLAAALMAVGILAGCGESSQQDDAMEAQKKADAEAKAAGTDKDSY